ncbi:hypothetical protein KKG65_03685 [Patescibacteria group bacterium]|nr:hypothetical protein [Patescibacteria group bacterium]
MSGYRVERGIQNWEGERVLALGNINRRVSQKGPVLVDKQDRSLVHPWEAYREYLEKAEFVAVPDEFGRVVIAGAFPKIRSRWQGNKELKGAGLYTAILVRDAVKIRATLAAVQAGRMSVEQVERDFGGVDVDGLVGMLGSYETQLFLGKPVVVEKRNAERVVQSREPSVGVKDEPKDSAQRAALIFGGPRAVVEQQARVEDSSQVRKRGKGKIVLKTLFGASVAVGLSSCTVLPVEEPVPAPIAPTGEEAGSLRETEEPVKEVVAPLEETEEPVIQKVPEAPVATVEPVENFDWDGFVGQTGVDCLLTDVEIMSIEVNGGQEAQLVVVDTGEVYINYGDGWMKGEREDGEDGVVGWYFTGVGGARDLGLYLTPVPGEEDDGSGVFFIPLSELGGEGVEGLPVELPDGAIKVLRKLMPVESGALGEEDLSLEGTYGEGMTYELETSFGAMPVKIYGYFMEEQLKFADPENGPGVLWGEFLKALAANPAMRRHYGWTSTQQVENYLASHDGVLDYFVYPVRDLDAPSMTPNPVKLIEEPKTVDFKQGFVLVYGQDPAYPKQPTILDAEEGWIMTQKAGAGYKVVVRDGEIRIHASITDYRHVTGINTILGMYFELFGSLDEGFDYDFHKEVFFRGRNKEVIDLDSFWTANAENTAYTHCLLNTKNHDFDDPIPGQ